MKKPMRKKALTTTQKLRAANKERKELAIQLATTLRTVIDLETEMSAYNRDLKAALGDKQKCESEIRQLLKIVGRTEESMRSRLRVIHPKDHYAEPEMISLTKQYTKRCDCDCGSTRAVDAEYRPVPVKTEECKLIEYLLFDVLGERHNKMAGSSKSGSF